jgi:hypothetical protein
MLDLRQDFQLHPTITENLREPADAIDVDMLMVNPFRLRFSRRNPPKTNTHKFVQFFGGDKPGTQRIGCFTHEIRKNGAACYLLEWRRTDLRIATMGR